MELTPLVVTDPEDIYSRGVHSTPVAPGMANHCVPSGQPRTCAQGNRWGSQAAIRIMEDLADSRRMAARLIPTLEVTGSNYTSWHTALRYVTSQVTGQANYLDAPPPSTLSPQCDHIIRGLVFWSVTATHRDLIACQLTAHEAFTTISCSLSDLDRPSLVALWHSVIHHRVDPSQPDPIRHYLHTLRQQVGHINQTHIDHITDHTFGLLIELNLPPCFEACREELAQFQAANDAVPLASTTVENIVLSHWEEMCDTQPTNEYSDPLTQQLSLPPVIPTIPTLTQEARVHTLSDNTSSQPLSPASWPATASQPTSLAHQPNSAPSPDSAQDADIHPPLSAPPLHELEPVPSHCSPFGSHTQSCYACGNFGHWSNRCYQNPATCTRPVPPTKSQLQQHNYSQRNQVGYT